MGVTPAIATMVLISGTMVLALVVGAYSYSLFKPNVAQIVLTSALLYGGATTDNLTVRATASLTLFLKNPDVTTNISSINLADSGGANPITSWSVSPTSASGNSFPAGGQNILQGGKSTPLTLYPISNPSHPILIGQVYDYDITLANGQSISGALIAQ